MEPSSYRMTFGVHEGTFLDELPAKYLDWLSKQDWIGKFPEIVEYVEKNREHIDLLS